MRSFRKCFSLIAILLLAVLFIVPHSPIPRFLSWVIAPIEAPILRFGLSLKAGFAIPLTSFRAKRAILEENRKLRASVASLTTKVSLNKTLQAENDNLRSALGRVNGEPHLLLANVLAAEGRSLYGDMVIDVGTELGVRVGDIVLADPLIALGVIEEANLRLSKVRLFSKSGEKTQAFIGAFRGEITGRGSGTMEVELPHDTTLLVGESVRLAPTEKQKTGFALGIVGKVVSSADKINALIAVPLNIHDLDGVFVVTQ